MLKAALLQRPDLPQHSHRSLPCLSLHTWEMAPWGAVGVQAEGWETRQHGGCSLFGGCAASPTGDAAGGIGAGGGHIHLPLELGLGFHTLSSTSPAPALRGGGECAMLPQKGIKPHAAPWPWQGAGSSCVPPSLLKNETQADPCGPAGMGAGTGGMSLLPITPWDPVTPARQGAGGLEPHATPTCFSPSAPQWGFPASSCHPGWDFHSAGAHPKTWHSDWAGTGLRVRSQRSPGSGKAAAPPVQHPAPCARPDVRHPALAWRPGRGGGKSTCESTR